MYVHSQQNLLKDPTEVWKFTVDTEATEAGEKTTGIPLNLYNQNNVIVNVDWGDGTTSTLTSADYAIDDSRASVHEYETAGVYQIKISSYKWNKLYLLCVGSPAHNYYTSIGNEGISPITSPNNANIPIYYWRRTLINIINEIPLIKGCNCCKTNAINTYDNVLAFLFANCIHLKSILKTLFIYNHHITSFKCCFCGCTSLTSIPKELFSRNTSLNILHGCFYGCTSLTTIPNDLFKFNPHIADFGFGNVYGGYGAQTAGCFENCTGLTSIPEDLFRYIDGSFYLMGCFKGCTSLTSIPENLFKYNIQLTEIKDCFKNCTGLTSIPENLFKYNINLQRFLGCFNGCTSLTSIPENLFKYNTEATGFGYAISDDYYYKDYGCFTNCTSLTSIPENLFKYNTKTTCFNACFSHCSSLQSIPSGLFDNNTAVTNFNNCFLGCSSLQSIPSGLFDNNTAVTNFTKCFYNCSSLRSIPSGLFDNNTAVTTFYACFSDCSSLQSIPSGLFDNNTAVTSFYACFYGCTSLRSIPSGLFDNNTAVTDFGNCFYQCTSLQSIPSGLFDKNIAVDSFGYCFYNCTSLQSIPSGLFDKNTAVTSFAVCFSGCTSLTNFKLIIGSPSVTNFSSFVSTTSNVTRIVCVPDNSTTYTTLSSYAQIGNYKNNITVSTHAIDCVQTMEYTVDTDATTTDAKVATIPLSAVQNASSKLLIDWGDGNGVELLPSEVTTANLIHTYSTAGNYQITVGTINWLDYQFLADSNAVSSNALIQTFRETVVSIDESIPPVANNSNLDYWFYNCKKLVSYTGHIFDNLPNATSAVSTFNGCTSLSVISAGTLRNQENLTNAASMFEECTTVTYIPSGLISQCRQLTNATQMFKNCTSLTYYPNTLLLNNTALTTRTNMFAGCSNTNPTFYTKTQLESNGYYVELYDTEATHESGNTVGIPFNLTEQSVTLTVDWGDSNTDSLTSSNYTASNSTASVHQYVNVGLYFVSIQSTNWNDTWICTICTANSQPQSYSNSVIALVARQNTLIEASTKIPPFQYKRRYYYTSTNFENGYYNSRYVMGFYFVWCTQLKRVCPDLFQNVTYASYFEYCFYGCTSLQSIPSGLFDNLHSIDFSECFGYCSSLQSIPSGLFDKNTAATNFGNCFYHCTSLQSIPEGLFDNNTAATKFNCCFASCTSLQSIPSGLFDNNTAVTDFGDCFYYCSSLQSIPSGLFDNNTAVTTFQSCFNGCTSIQSIPSGLFDNNTAVTRFDSCFSDCSSIQSIPEGLFDNNTAVTTFYACFFGCSSLQFIPSGLFDSNTTATNFSYCFRNCSSLQSIPTGLFDHNTAVTSFQSCFYGCISLQSIPSGLFNNNTAVTNFSYCFYDCSSLTDFTLYIGSSLVSNCSSFVTKKAGTTRTVYVPADSTTYTTFSNLADTLELTILTLISLAKLIEETYPQSGFNASTDSMGMEIEQGAGFIIAGTGENNVYISLSQSNYISKLVDGIEYLLGTFNVSDLTSSGKTTFGFYLSEENYGYGSGYEYYTPIDEHTLESSITFNINDLTTNKNVSYTLENICLDDHDGWVFGDTTGSNPENGLGNVVIRVALSQNDNVGSIYAKWISPTSLNVN